MFSLEDRTGHPLSRPPAAASEHTHKTLHVHKPVCEQQTVTLAKPTENVYNYTALKISIQLYNSPLDNIHAFV